MRDESYKAMNQIDIIQKLKNINPNVPEETLKEIAEYLEAKAQEDINFFFSLSKVSEIMQNEDETEIAKLHAFITEKGLVEAIKRYWFEERVKQKDFSILYNSLVNGLEEELRIEINKFLLENISYYDSGESFYHGVLTGILSRMEGYILYSNIESGLGRSDIIIEPIDDRKPAIIIELKIAKSEDELETRCSEALNQIETKKYDMYLRKENFKNIIKYGVAFCGKICQVKKA